MRRYTNEPGTVAIFILLTIHRTTVMIHHAATSVNVFSIGMRYYFNSDTIRHRSKTILVFVFLIKNMADRGNVIEFLDNEL